MHLVEVGIAMLWHHPQQLFRVLRLRVGRLRSARRSVQLEVVFLVVALLLALTFTSDDVVGAVFTVNARVFVATASVQVARKRPCLAVSADH